MFGKLIQAVFALVLAGAVPVLSYQTARRLELLALPRLSLYLSAAFSQWLLAGLGLVTVAISMTFGDIGIRPLAPRSFFLWTSVITAVSLAALSLVVWAERRGWWPDEPELVHALIPRTRKEKLWALMVIAPTAAICEEFLYRGFLLATVLQWLHSVAWALALSSVAFGLAHFYQGLNGIVRAALLGALLAWPVVRMGTILPSTASHFVIDAVALGWLGPKLLATKSTVDSQQ